jgi:hypothetical protein
MKKKFYKQLFGSRVSPCLDGRQAQSRKGAKKAQRFCGVIMGNEGSAWA